MTTSKLIAVASGKAPQTQAMEIGTKAGCIEALKLRARVGDKLARKWCCSNNIHFVQRKVK